MKLRGALLTVVAATVCALSGLVSPRDAAASIDFVNQWPATPTIVSNGTTSPVIGKFKAGMGTNRLLVVAVATEYSAAQAPTFTVTYGGQSLNSGNGAVILNNTTGNNKLWIGYLNEAGIVAAGSNTTLSVTPSTNANLTALYATVAVFNGVYQTTPITGFNSLGTSATALTIGPVAYTLTANAGLAGNNGLSVYLVNWNNNVQGETTAPAGYTRIRNYLGSNFALAGGYKVTTGASVESITSTTTTTSAIAALGGFGLNPAVRLSTILAGACGDCHGNPPVDGSARNVPPGGFQGSHEKHAGDGDVGYSYACTVCHRNNTTTTHANGNKNIAGTGLPALTYRNLSTIATTNTPTLGTCTNLNCHSNGRGPGMGTVQYTPPTWGGTTTCLSCHAGRAGTGNGAQANSTAGFKLSTTHSQHLKYPAANVNCNMCHGKTAAFDGTTLTLKQYTGVIRHDNGIRDVVFNDVNYGSYTSYKTSGGDVGKCSNVSCHGGKTRSAWSATTTNNYNTCVHCHGVDTTPAALPNVAANRKFFAPGWNNAGTSTDQVAVSTDMRVGAHFVHLSSAISKQIKCNECHIVPTNPFDANHMTGPRFSSQTVVFTQASTANKNAVTPVVVPGTPGASASCTTTYCHGASMPGGDTTGLAKSPTWNNTAYIPSTLTAPGSCNTCHGFPPSTGSGHPTATAPVSFPSANCNCHSNMNSAGTTYSNIFVNKNLHMNGIFEPAAGGHTYGYGGNKHSAAAGATPFTACSGCHTVNGATTGYPLARGLQPDCTMCHFNGVTSANFTGANPGCYDCHGKGKGAVANYSSARPYGATFPNWSGSHQAHVITGLYICTDCHSGGGTGTTTHGNYSGILKSRNSTSIKMGFNTAKAGTAATSNWVGSNVTCSTSFCHGQKTANWGVKTSTTQCTKCHGVVNGAYLTNYSSALIAPGGSGRDTNQAIGTTIRGGTHQEHLATSVVTNAANSIHCGECHVVVTPASLATHLNMTTATITFGPRAKANSHLPTVARTSGIINCSATWCHTGKFNSGAAMTPAWNNTAYLSGATPTLADCKQCHGMPPRSVFGHPTTAGVITAISGANAFTLCTGCHSNLNLSPASATAANIFATPAKHIDGTIDVSSHTYPYPGGSPQHKTDAGTTWASCSGCHSTSATGVTYAAWSVDAANGHKKVPPVAPNCSVCHINGLANASCSQCHGAAVNNGTALGGMPGVAGSNLFPNISGSHRTHMNNIAGVTCSNCHSGFGSASVNHGFANTTTTTKARIAQVGTGGRLNFVGLATTPTWVPATNSCNNTCHGSGAVWGGRLKCTDCHGSPQTRTKGRPGVVIQSVVGEFTLAWGHKKSTRGAVADSDCIVCHLEGKYTGAVGTAVIKTAFHADGNIDLRDPDGAGETPITDMSGVAWTFQRFSTSFAAGSRTSTGNTANTIDNIITQKFCMKCHDSNGAANTFARSNNGGTGTNAMPFGGIALGASYTAANGAIGAQGTINVFSQFSSGNSSAHPVRKARNKDFPTATRMADPFKPTGTRGTSGTLSLGVTITCNDCHKANNTQTRRMIASHGNAVTITGRATTSGTTFTVGTNDVTFCKECHLGYDTSTVTHHSTGSALSSSTNNGMSGYLRYGCNVCHSSGYNTAVVRPVRAMDAHGVNALPSGGVAKTGRWLGSYGTPAQTNLKPYAFIRNGEVLADHRPLKIGGSTYTPGCNMANSTPNCNQGDKTFTGGGTY